MIFCYTFKFKEVCMNFLTRFVRTLLLAVVVAVGAGYVSDVAAQGKSGATMFTDSRDGQKYRTVKIGRQVWMAENLSFKIGGSWCYNNNESNCRKYGRLYNWNIAKRVGAIGWHLPSKEEWTELETVVGSSTAGKKLKSTSGWYDVSGVAFNNGTDEYGFSALPGGFRGDYDDGNGYGFSTAGVRGIWWEAGGDSRGMLYHFDNLEEYGSEAYNEDFGISVRCVEDN
jgi:uncharacterized protein (TIGR02145 family)